MTTFGFDAAGVGFDQAPFSTTLIVDAEASFVPGAGATGATLRLVPLPAPLEMTAAFVAGSGAMVTAATLVTQAPVDATASVVAGAGAMSAAASLVTQAPVDAAATFAAGSGAMQATVELVSQTDVDIEAAVVTGSGAMSATASLSATPTPLAMIARVVAGAGAMMAIASLSAIPAPSPIVAGFASGAGAMTATASLTAIPPPLAMTAAFVSGAGAMAATASLSAIPAPSAMIAGYRSGVGSMGATAVTVDPPLMLGDFDTTGLQVTFAALIEAGDDSQSGGIALFNDASNWTLSGSLLDGDLALDSTSAVHRILYVGGSPGLLRFNDNPGPIHLGDYFDGGDGVGLSIYIQVQADSRVSFVGSDTIGSLARGNNWVNFDSPGGVDTVIAGIAAGERFIIALGQLIPVDAGAAFTGGAGSMGATAELVSHADLDAEASFTSGTGAMAAQATLSTIPAPAPMVAGFTSGSGAMQATAELVSHPDLDVIAAFVAGASAMQATAELVAHPDLGIAADFAAGAGTMQATAELVSHSDLDIAASFTAGAGAMGATATLTAVPAPLAMVAGFASGAGAMQATAELVSHSDLGIAADFAAGAGVMVATAELVSHPDLDAAVGFVAGAGAMGATATLISGVTIATIPRQPNETVRALLTSGGSTTWYNRRSGATDGDFTADSDITVLTAKDIVRIRWGGTSLLVNTSGGVDWTAIVATGGAGDDLEIRLATQEGTVQLGESERGTTGGSFITWDPDTAGDAIFNQVVDGSLVNIVISNVVAVRDLAADFRAGSGAMVATAELVSHPDLDIAAAFTGGAGAMQATAELVSHADLGIVAAFAGGAGAMVATGELVSHTALDIVATFTGGAGAMVATAELVSHPDLDAQASFTAGAGAMVAAASLTAALQPLPMTAAFVSGTGAMQVTAELVSHPDLAIEAAVVSGAGAMAGTLDVFRHPAEAVAAFVAGAGSMGATAELVSHPDIDVATAFTGGAGAMEATAELVSHPDIVIGAAFTGGAGSVSAAPTAFYRPVDTGTDFVAGSGAMSALAELVSHPDLDVEAAFTAGAGAMGAVASLTGIPDPLAVGAVFTSGGGAVGASAELVSHSDLDTAATFTAGAGGMSALADLVSHVPAPVGAEFTSGAGVMAASAAIVLQVDLAIEAGFVAGAGRVSGTLDLSGTPTPLVIRASFVAGSSAMGADLAVLIVPSAQTGAHFVAGAGIMGGAPDVLDNVPPIVRAQLQFGRSLIMGGETIALEGYADDLNDPNEHLVYQWSAPSGHFNDPTAPSPTWTAPPAGPDSQVIVLRLTVEDPQGATGYAEVTVTILAQRLMAERIDQAAIEALLVSQWSNSTRLKTLIDAILEIVTELLVEPAAEIERMTRLDTAEGVWLNYIGDRVGLGRPGVRRADFTTWGFDAAGVGFDQAAFSTTIDALTLRDPVGDDYYRIVLRMRIASLLGRASVADLEELIAVEYPTGRLEDHQDMTVTIHVEPDPDRQNILEITTDTMQSAVGAGIAVTVQVGP